MEAYDHLKRGGNHLTEEGTALYVDALKLDRVSELPEWMIVHISECGSCKENITGLYALLANENYAGVKKHPFFDAQTPATVRTWYRVAAVIVLTAAISTAAFLLFSDKAGPSAPSVVKEPRPVDTNHVRPPTSPPVAENREFAAAFTESPDMEILVNSELRSGGVKISSPLTGAEVHGELRFDWSGGPPGPAVIEVYNNRRELRRTLTAAEPPLTLREVFPPGLYYWKLTADDEMLYMGKVFVRPLPPAQ